MTAVLFLASAAPSWLFALLPVLLGGGLIGAVATHRAQNRKTDAETSQILQDTYHEALADLREQMGQLRDDARGARAEAAEARHAAAGAKEEAQKAVQAQYAAETRAAELEAKVARSEHVAGEERHALQGKLAELAVKRDLLQIEINDMRTAHNLEIHEMRTAHDKEIAGLRAEVETLRARIGIHERRQRERRE